MPEPTTREATRGTRPRGEDSRALSALAHAVRKRKALEERESRLKAANDTWTAKQKARWDAEMTKRKISLSEVGRLREDAAEDEKKARVACKRLLDGE